MIRRRVIACLDVDSGRVVKGTRFRELRDVGDPVRLADRYQRDGADEVVFLDISATAEGRRTVLDVVRRTAERLFVPLTVGGGISTVDDIAGLLRAGADKVSINSAAHADPALLTAAARRFGSQCIVASIDSRRIDGADRVVTHGGKRPTERETIAWAAECDAREAGEILLTSIDHDGTRHGFDLDLTRAVRDAVRVPVVASGGAGAPAHFVDVFRETDCDAALAAGIFHERIVPIPEVKRAMATAGLPVRESP